MRAVPQAGFRLYGDLKEMLKMKNTITKLNNLKPNNRILINNVHLTVLSNSSDEDIRWKEGALEILEEWREIELSDKQNNQYRLIVHPKKDLLFYKITMNNRCGCCEDRLEKIEIKDVQLLKP